MLGPALLEHVRLSALLALRTQPGYAANASVIRDDLASYHFHLNVVELGSVLRWLADAGLVTQTAAGAILTDEGLAVTNGYRQVPGVRRPSQDTVQRLALQEAARLGVSRLGG
jgi:hypothetical protein